MKLAEMHPIPEGINPDLAEERKNIDFNLEELTHLMDGGSDKTEERRKLERFCLDHPLIKEQKKQVLETLGSIDRYNYELERGIRVARVARDAEENGIDNALRGMLGAGLGLGLMPDGNPLSLHFVMFLPTLIGQGTTEQIADIVGKAWNLELIGTYAQTELGHGTFVRGLELTAEYDPANEEFELNSPSLTSYKWWPGGLGRTASYAVVMAQMITQGENRGVHPFLIQLRDEETHQTLPGVILGEIGPKMGMNGNDNGFLGFNKFRTPRSSLLARNSRVEPDGSYVSPPREKLGYATMVFVRVAVAMDIALLLRKAVTIAVRFSAVRRQGEPDAAGRETKIIDFQTQQEKLFPAIALAVGLHMASETLWNMYNNVQNEIQQGNFDNLPELHALSCAMKTLTTSESSKAIDILRRACGGLGFMASSGLPRIFGLASAACTYEGENTVLQLQIARYLLKCGAQAREGNPQPPSVAYLNNTFGHKKTIDIISDFGLVELFEKVAGGLVRECIDKDEGQGILATQAAEAHAKSFVISEFAQGLMTAGVSQPLRRILSDLYRLLACTWILQSGAEFIKFSGVTFGHLDRLRSDRDSLLSHIRPVAVGLVDAFDFSDEILDSTIGSYDGWIYHRLFQASATLKSNQGVSSESAGQMVDRIKAKL